MIPKCPNHLVLLPLVAFLFRNLYDKKYCHEAACKSAQPKNLICASDLTEKNFTLIIS